MIIKITEKTAGQRLDKFLTTADSIWPSLPSRSQIQKMVKQGLIKINGSPVSPHYGLKSGDKINIQKKSLKSGRPATRKAASAPAHDIKIIDQTGGFLVINKPAGIAVHGGADYALVDWLKAEIPAIKNVGDDRSRPGIVHRLDKGVSGLMVIAKTQPAFDHLKKQFQQRTIIKEYTALVYGQIHKAEGLINFPIARSKNGYKMAAVPLTDRGEPSKIGRLAITQFQIISRLINFTLLKIKIKTGRTHQIRVHLAAYGHPVVGDDVYGSAKAKAQNKKLGRKRIFLVADRLGFSDLENKPRDYKISLTEELIKILKNAK